ncbi:protein tesmin/TSO1-like CXC 2 [Malus sylvestris]|uniref:protein tesmin/TSO1-like CXC 2 n=1 Tax=Malus sylvestris TaxID=3752 RepID=UPI0021ABBC66|nr:protein tesmin/TSO1-like CXC 2 [Malus sylvestris]
MGLKFWIVSNFGSNSGFQIALSGFENGLASEEEEDGTGEAGRDEAKLIGLSSPPKIGGNYEAFMWSRHLMLVDQEADPCDAGLKRCNCRRSKCLKLYCECFSAGVYCLDSYACQNCYNKPEFEHTVFEIHHHIESRNPLAFTSKVVDNAIDSSANSTEDQNLMTTSSARHKRGCNCKKSKCLEKYCERYQAKVGCFGGCRCEDCQNTFGTMAGQILFDMIHLTFLVFTRSFLYTSVRLSCFSSKDNETIEI